MQAVQNGEVYDEDQMSSSEDSVDEGDKETKLIIQFEENLKKRVFYADRVEKIEKALIQLNLVAKDTTFCSDFEYERFTEFLG